MPLPLLAVNVEPLYEHPVHAPIEIVLADLDQDGDADLVVADGNPRTQRVVWMANDGVGGFRSGADELDATGTGLLGVDVADFDADGFVDVLAAFADGGEVTLSAGLGGGSFAAPVTLAQLTDLRSVAVADVDRDGRDDLLVTADREVGWLRNAATGWATFEPLFRACSTAIAEAGSRSRGRASPSSTRGRAGSARSGRGSPTPMLTATATWCSSAPTGSPSRSATARVASARSPSCPGASRTRPTT